MANTFELIASSTAGSGGVASFTFSSIPSTYTDLNLVLSLRSSGGDDYFSLALNSSTSSFSLRQLYGTGSTAGSTSRSDGLLTATQVPSSYTSSTFSNVSMYIPNYAGSTNKSISLDTVLENNATGTQMALDAILWSNSAAINRIDVTHPSSTFAQYSTAYLYGVKNA
jgi:hypothetical protein